MVDGTSVFHFENVNQVERNTISLCSRACRLKIVCLVWWHIRIKWRSEQSINAFIVVIVATSGIVFYQRIIGRDHAIFVHLHLFIVRRIGWVTWNGRIVICLIVWLLIILWFEFEILSFHIGIEWVSGLSYHCYC